MTHLNDEENLVDALRERLARLSEASLQINDSLDHDAVLQRVLDSARSITGARYGVMTTLGESMAPDDVLASGMTPEEAQEMWAMPGGMEFFEYLRTIPGPFRVADFAEHTGSMGLPAFQPPAPMSSFLSVPIRHRENEVGGIYLAKAEPGDQFSQEDEETLSTFASQAAMVIANARRYRDEQRARASLETLVETSPVGVVVFDAATGGPLFFNREVVRIVEELMDENQPPEHLLELLTCRRADGREYSLVEWPLSEALSEGETVRAEEITLSLPDGRSVTALLNATPIRAEDGEIESFVVTLQDMAPLQELEQLRAEFLGMVSHELRAPLASIRGSATTMQEASDDLDAAELRQFLRIIVEQADNMRELIEDLLDITRIETGTLPVHPEPAEVAVIVDRARNIFLSGGGRGELDITIPADLPLVMVDRRRIVQVLGNLLANAARHSPESSPIRVSAAREGGHVAVSVTDEGRGIPAQRLALLFRRFSTNVSDEGGRDGAGLGLAICKGIVEALGGRIWAESEGDALGARFTFTMPLAQGERSAARAGDTGSQPRESQGQSILAVDDDPQMLRHIRSTLLRAGFEPMVAATPEEALRLAQENQPHLILLDMMLPGADGIEVMRDIFSLCPAPVIFLSAYGHDQMVARAFEAGAMDYIMKPFTTTELTARVRAALLRQKGYPETGPLTPYVAGNLTIDYDERRVYLAGEQVHLTPKEYSLLHTLSINAGRVVTHTQLLRRLWSADAPGNIQRLRTLMRRLRVKLGENADSSVYFTSEARVGYRMLKESSQPQE